ncbi:MAG: hypothetical protein ABW061_14315, partial [Polyangiaceae bacterium]
MTQDFRPEDMFTAQRAVVGLLGALLFTASSLIAFGVSSLARTRAALATRIPARFRAPALAALFALVVLGLTDLGYRWLTANAFPLRLADSLTPDFAGRLLLGVCGLLLSLGLALRLLRARVPVALRLLSEALLVPCAYAIGLSIIYLALTLTELEVWDGFKRAAFFSAAVFALPVALVPGVYRARGLPVVLSVLLLLVYGDLIYLRYFGNILPVLAIGAGGQIWDVRDIIVKYTHAGDAWLLLVILTSLALPFLWPKAPPRDAPLALRGALDLLLVGACVALLLPVPGIVQRWMDSDRSWRVLNGTDAVQDSGIVVAHVKEVARSIRDARLHGTITDAEFAKVRAYHAARAAGPNDDPDFGLARGTNLLILQVEAMQKWVIGAHDRGQELTPFLNRLHDRAWFFDRLYDETGDSSTADAEYMVLNSQFPIPQGSV